MSFTPLRFRPVRSFTLWRTRFILRADGHRCIYHLLHDGTVYQDLGASYFKDRDRSLIKRRAVRNLERLGLRVSLESAA